MAVSVNGHLSLIDKMVSTGEPKEIYSKHDEKFYTKLILEVTKDTYFLKQYYKIREALYRRDLHLENFSGEEDQYDLDGDIVIVRIGQEVVGGGRINYSKPQSRIPLVLEEEGFYIAELFPDLELENEVYCEISRLALSEQYRCGKKVISLLIEKIVERAKLSGVKYIFTVSPMIQAKIYKMIGRTLGLDFKISAIKVPAKEIYGGITMVLSSTELTPVVEHSKAKEPVMA